MSSTDAPEGSFAPLFAQADEILQRISLREAEVKGLKEDLGVDQSAHDIEVDIADFEQIVDATGSDGAGDTGEK